MQWRPEFDMQRLERRSHMTLCAFVSCGNVHTELFCGEIREVIIDGIRERHGAWKTDTLLNVEDEMGAKHRYKHPLHF